MATKLHPFRQYNENDVINLFTYDGTSVDAGRLLKLDSSNQWSGLGSDDYVDLGSDTGNSYSNVVSTQYTLKGKLDLAGLADRPLGINTMAMADTDENGEKLAFNPRKQAELQASLTGQAVPIATRGLFLMATGAWANSPGVVFNQDVFATGNGQVTTLGNKATNNRIGRTLGNPDADGSVLVKFDFTQG